MEHISSFGSGLDSDTTKLKLKPDKYRAARNIRLISSGLDSSYALCNVDGNEFSFKIPTTSNIIKLTISSFPSIVSFNINGTAIGPISVNSTNGYSSISTLLNSKLGLIGLGITSSYSDTSLFIYSKVNGSNLIPTLNVVISSLVGISISTGSLGTGNNWLNSQINPQIIGSTTIRDAIILFTTSDISKNPGGHDSSSSATPSSAGQIWRLSYDPISLTPSLTLLYNNYIDFTTFHPIPPSAAEGRYETSIIQPVWWTDNFNELRRFNTTDPNGFATDPTLLNSRPNLDFDIPILQQIHDSGGILPVGVYQAAYRLKNTTGAETIYSKASNLVSIINNLADTTPFRNYIATGSSNSGKSITWNIDNLDIDFERIEVVILYRAQRNDIAIIDQIFDEPIPASGNFTFTYTGSETKIPVDINDFLSITSSFTHAKTLVSKTNQLLVGNTRNITFDIDYDARAYRWRQVNSINSTKTVNGATTITLLSYNSNTTEVIDSQGTILTVDKNNYSAVPEIHDTINPEQTIQTNDTYRFQSNGITIGGEGPNIKYKFNTRWFTGDDNIHGNGFGAMNLDISTGLVGENGRFTNNQPGSFTLDNNTFKNNNLYDSFKSPYISSAFKGYQHDEIVPFAIRFFDKKGFPGFAKWIADIRMPLIYEDNNGTPIPFLTTDLNGFAGAERVGILIPEFTVNIPSNLKDKISGFEIIRCERKTEDKSILAAGTLHPVEFDSFSSIFYAATPEDKFAGGPEIQQEIAGFKSPEFSFLNFPGYQSGDTIKIVGILNNSFTVVSTNPAPPDIFIFHKNYTLSPVTGTIGHVIEQPLGEAKLLNKDGTDSIAGSPILNRTNPSAATKSIGEQIVVLNWQIGSPVALFGGGGQQNKYYAYYKRVATNQYGGNTYSQRSNREYISTGHYQEINNNSPGTFIIEIAGGDIYTAVFDTQRIIKGWLYGGGGNFISTTHYFPLETVLNTEWRAGQFPNKNGFDDSGLVNNCDLGETYVQYDDGWAFEDNVKLAYPKPAIFTNVQEYDNRVYISQVKINGEVTDSWGIFKTLDYRDLEGSKGPITALLNFKDNIYAIQQSGVSILPINQNVVIPDNSSSTLELGSGKGIEKPVYLSTTEGSNHQWSCITSDTAIYFFDIKSKLIYKVRSSTEPMSLLEGMISFLTKNINGTVINHDNPVYENLSIGVGDARSGIVATYDYQNYEVLFTFHDSTAGATRSTPIKSHFTIAHSEVINAFTTEYDFFPSIYINNKRLIATTQDGNNVYLQDEGNPGEFYGTTFPSNITFLANPNPTVKKSFDALEFTTEVSDPANQGINIKNETWSSIKCITDHQNTGTIILTPEITVKRRERSWNFQIPRNLINPALVNPDILNSANLTIGLFQERLRDNYISVTLTFNNKINGVFRRLIAPDVKLMYRPSIR